MGIKYIEHVNGTANPDKIAVEYAVKDSAGNIIKDTYLKTWRPIKYNNTTLNDATTTLEFIAGSNISLSFSSGQLTIGNTYSYTHPSYDSATAAAVKVGRDATGHVVLGAALTASDVGALPSNTTYVSSVNGSSGVVTLTIPTITLNGSATTTPSFYAPTGAGTSGYVLKSNGSGAPSWAAESDEKLKVAAATSGSSYNILLGSGLPAATRQISDEIQFIPGLSSGVQPNSTLYIGSAGNGQICFYTPVSKDKRYTYLKPASNGAAGSANALTVYLPYNSLVSGTQSHYLISALQRGTAIGGSTQSVYIDTNGVVTAGSTYAGGTAVTLNGTSAAASTASFYAPTGAGTSGQYLTSSGSGAPTWVDAIWKKTTSGGIVYPTNNPVAADYNIGNVIIFGADTINGDDVKTSSGTKGTILLHGNITIGLNASAPAASTSYVFPAAANLALPDGNLSYITNFLFSTPGQNTAAQKPTSITMGTGITLNFASSINPSSAASSIQGGIDASGSKGSLIIGNAITTTAQNTFLMGNFIYNTGTWTVAIGQGLYNTAQSNFILGSRNKSSGNRSLIIGTDHLSTVSNSVLLGKGHDTTNGIANIVAVGQYSSITSTSAFVVGNGTANDARSNAFVVHSDGRATVSAAPTNDMDVATKKYVDDNAGGSGSSDVVVIKTSDSSYGWTVTHPQFSLNQVDGTLTSNKGAEITSLVSVSKKTVVIIDDALILDYENSGVTKVYTLLQYEVDTSTDDAWLRFRHFSDTAEFTNNSELLIQNNDTFFVRTITSTVSASTLWITPGTTTWSEVATTVMLGGIVAYKSNQTQLAGAQQGKIFYMSEYNVTGLSSLSGTVVLTSTGRVISNNTTYPGYEELIWTLSGTSSGSTITIAGATHNVVPMIDADSTSY